MLELVFENHTSDKEFSEGVFKNIFERALTHLKLTEKNVELGLQLIEAEKSQELNNTHRGKDKPTDALSFPLEEKALEKHGILPLGDIFICLEVARRQADEQGIPTSQEMARLAVHGLLHLLGYDHETSESDAAGMFDLGGEIIKSANIKVQK